MPAMLANRSDMCRDAVRALPSPRDEPVGSNSTGAPCGLEEAAPFSAIVRPGFSLERATETGVGRDRPGEGL
jgi:hypothetical protein